MIHMLHRRGTRMPTESHVLLIFRIRQHLKNGHLPVMVPKQAAAGCGSGRVCEACNQPITSTQIECEVDDDRDGYRLRFHLDCHLIWQLECTRDERCT
jgi:hypothetical protein